MRLGGPGDRDGSGVGSRRRRWVESDGGCAEEEMVMKPRQQSVESVTMVWVLPL